MKRLAVLMPVYNTKEDFLRASIDSILNQTYTDFDFYIINDGSTDKNVEKVITSYKDDRIIFINNKENKGIAKTLNQGLDLCKNYEYIARMDSDDISLQDRFMKQINYLDSHKNVGVLGTGFKIFPENRVILPAQHYTIKNLLNWRPWISHPTIMFRTDILNKFNLRYNPEYEYAEDYELWTRIIDYTKIENIQEILLHYRLESHNVSKIKNKEQLLLTEKIKANLSHKMAAYRDYNISKLSLVREIKTNLDHKMTVNNIPIFLASNDAYAPFVATTIASIVYNTNSFCEFYILDSGISDLNKKRIEKLKEKFSNFSIEFLPVDLKLFENFQLTNHISSDAYSRYLIPLLKPNLNKVIYLDVDIIALGDIKELFDIELGDRYLGAVAEQYLYDLQTKIADNINIKQSSYKKFFNSGVLLINNKKWVKDNIIEKLFKLQEEYNSKLTHGDQDILIKQFYEDYLELNPKFNLLTGQIYYKNSYRDVNIIDNAIKKPIIRHFENISKPWLTNKNYYSKGKINNFEDFWFFAKMTDFHDNILMRYNNNKINEVFRQYFKERRLYEFNKEKINAINNYNYGSLFFIFLQFCITIVLMILLFKKRLNLKSR